MSAFSQLPEGVKSLIQWEEAIATYEKEGITTKSPNVAIHDVSFFGHHLLLKDFLDLKEPAKELALVGRHGVSVSQIYLSAQGEYHSPIQLLTRGIYIEDFKEAVKLWRKHKIKLVNLSMTIRTPEIVEVLNSFIKEGGIVIASSGNSGERLGKDLLPHYKEFLGLTVSASDLDGSLEGFSQIGPQSILAPGSIDLYPVDILHYRIAPRSEPLFFDDNLSVRTHLFGMTSSSAPLISGIVSLALRINPDLNQKEINTLILKSADRVREKPVLNAKQFLELVIESK